MSNCIMHNIWIILEYNCLTIIMYFAIIQTILDNYIYFKILLYDCTKNNLYAWIFINIIMIVSFTIMK